MAPVVWAAKKAQLRARAWPVTHGAADEGARAPCQCWQAATAGAGAKVAWAGLVALLVREQHRLVQCLLRSLYHVHARRSPQPRQPPTQPRGVVTERRA